MLWALIDQTVVDLVADHQEILLHCNAREFGARCLIKCCTGGIRRISEEERLRPWRRGSDCSSVQTPTISRTRWD